MEFKMKIKQILILFFFFGLVCSEEKQFEIKDFSESGRLDALSIEDNSSGIYLIQLDVVNDSLMQRVLSFLINHLRL